jgi:xanthine/uracil permease
MLLERDETLSELFQDLTREIKTLVNENIELARVEVMAKLRAGQKGAAYVAAGGALLYAGLLGVMAAAAFLLALAMPLWVAALIVGVVVAIIGGVLVNSGIKEIKRATAPPQVTVETVKEESRWMKEEIKKP